MDKLRESRWRLWPLLIALIILLAGALVVLPWAAGPIGKGDFIGYWSSSRLLLQGSDPYGISNLSNLQFQAYPERGYVIYTWNPPWLPVLLLPVAWLPFQSATQIWILLNFIVMIVSGLAVWYGLTGNRELPAVAMATTATIFFPPALAAISAGQIIPWVYLASVAMVIWQLRNQHLALAGAVLPVVLLKPQVTFLAVAFSLWHGVRNRQWRFLGAATASLMGLLTIATVLYPGWLASYLNNIGGRSMMLWLTPTLGGILFALWPLPWIRYIGLLLVLMVPILYSRARQYPPWLVLGLVLGAGVAVSPFGWSFDQIVLLPLILYMIDAQRRLKHWWLGWGLLAIYLIPLMLHVIQVDELSYVWVSWLTLALYIGVMRTKPQAPWSAAVIS